jgi:hypothetical protein
MRRPTGALVNRTIGKVVSLLACWITIFTVAAGAQQGQNAVYYSGSPTPSPAFIDASMFAGSVSSPNFCSVLNYVLNPLNGIIPSTGAVIDARGLPDSTPPTSMTCSASPWVGITNPLPSTILLPAGTIQISSSWVLPSNTRLIGEGESDPLSAVPGTTIQAGNIQSQTGTMIQFGSSAVCGSSGCGGISIERLMDFLTALGQDVEITVKPRRKSHGEVSVVA